MERLTEQFLDYCRDERHLARQTVAVYRRHTRGLTVWLTTTRGPTTPAGVTADLIRGYLATKPHLSANSRAQAITALRSCFAYAAREGIVPASVAHRVALPKLGRRLPQLFSEAQLAAVLASVAAAGDWLAPRDLAILATYYYGGLRANELTALDLAQVDLEERLLLIRYGKADKDRLVPLAAPVVAALRAYLPLRAALRQVRRTVEPGEALFLSYQGGRLTRGSIADALKARFRAAGIPGRFHIHALRHCTATHLLNAGAPIEDVSELLGHTSLATTMIYRHATKAKLTATIDRYSRLGA